MADRITLSGAPEGLDALRVAERLGEGGTALFIARDASRAAQFTDARPETGKHATCQKAGCGQN